MISADSIITPRNVAARPYQASELAGIAPPRKISDATTEAAANNAMAAGYRAGTIRPGQLAKGGFSAGAQQRLQSAEQQAAGVNQGAQEAAGIRSEDQAFNAEQQARYQQLVQERMNSNYDTMTGMNNAGWQKFFTGQRNNLNLNMAQRQAWQNIRLALLSQME